MDGVYRLQVDMGADASALTAATRQGAKGFDELAAAGERAATATREAGAQATTAAAAEAAAGKRVSADVAADAAARKAKSDALRAERDAMQKARTEANLLAQANRQLGMQMTDVVTSVASGMPIWMVAIQQGGQIKDAYGGIGPALRAIAAMATPATIAIGGLAAGVGALALAYHQGSAEADAMARSIIMTGNAAGTTLSQMRQVQQSVGGATGSPGAAADAVTAAVGSGLIAAQSLERVTTVAVQAQRLLGVQVADTVAQFVELGRSPTAASAKLNEQQHYLTLSVYEQIRALEKRGRIVDAATLAQDAYADATKKRLAEVAEQLGLIERSWQNIKDVAAKGWNAMMNIGRPKTVAQEIAELKTKIAEITQLRDGGNGNEPRLGLFKMRAGELKEAEERLATLQVQALAEQETAAAEKSAADKTAETIRRREQMEAEAAARVAANVQRIRDALQAQQDAYAAAGQQLDAQHGMQLVSERAFYEGKRTLISQGTAAQLLAIQQEIAALQSRKLYSAEAIARDAQVKHLEAEANRARAKAATDTIAVNYAEAASLQQLARANADYWVALQRSQETRQRANDRDLAGRRLGDDARGVAGRMSSIADDFNAQQQRLADDYNNGRIESSTYQSRLAALRAYYNAALDQEQQYQDARTRLESDATVGFDRALANYAEKSRNVAKQSEHAWTTAFQAMEDGIVQFATTGKLSFDGLVNSIVAGLIRIWLQKQLVGMFDALGSYFGGTPGVGGVNGSAGNTFIPGNFAHTGATVGRDAPTFARMMPVSTWDRAPRLHSGRLNSDEYAAILQRDESVLTPGQMRMLAPAGRSSAAQVNVDLKVINQTGTPVQATTRRGSDGGLEVLLTAVKAAVADDLASGQGDITSALQGRYGLRPALA